MTPSKITATLGALDAVLDIMTDDADYLAVQIVNTWSGTITFQASLDGTIWNNVTLVNASSVDKHAATSTATSNGLFFHETMGVCHFRLKMTGYSSGTANLTVVTKRIGK